MNMPNQRSRSRLDALQLARLEHIGFDSNRSRRKLPPLQTLVAFEAAARLRSFTLAAMELNLTQPAISQQVKLLEDQLGVQLFKRSNNKIALSEQGEEFAFTVNEILNVIAESADQLSNDTVRATLTVSLLPSFAATWFASRIGSFSQAHPNTDLSLLSTVACTTFAQEGADVAIRWGLGGDENVYEEKLLSEQHILVSSPDVAAQIPNGAKLSELTDLSFAHDTAFTEWRTVVERNGADPSAFDQGLYFGDASALTATIASGHGIGVVRDIIADPYLRNGALVKLPFDGVEGSFAYHFLCPHHRLEQPRVQVFLNWLRHECGSAEQRPAA